MILERDLDDALTLYATFIRKGIGHVNMENLCDRQIRISVYTNIEKAKTLTYKKPEIQNVPADELGDGFEVAHFVFPEA